MKAFVRSHSSIIRKRLLVAAVNSRMREQGHTLTVEGQSERAKEFEAEFKIIGFLSE